MPEHLQKPREPEKLLTVPQAAEILGVHQWALRRAIKRGDIPAYQPFNSRKLVKLSDIQAAVEASKIGGAT